MGENDKEFEGYGWATPQMRTFMCVMVVGLVAAFDFVATSMSIQPYYYLLGGDKRLYGLVVGVYDLAQFLAAPVFGYIADHAGYKFLFSFGVFLTFVGNVMYAMLFVINDNMDKDSAFSGWHCMMLARAVMGVGSGVIITGSTFITRKTDMIDRFPALGAYRVYQTMSRMIGPMVGFFFVDMPVDVQSTAEGGTLKNQLINFYTLPGWLAAGLGLLGTLFVLRYFDETACPDAQDQHSYHSTGGGSITWIALTSYFIQAVYGACVFSIFSNIFAFATAKFHVVHAQMDLWKPYVAIGVGTIFSIMVWKKAKKKYEDKIAFEKTWARVAMTIGIAAWAFLIGTWKEAHPPEWHMYASFALSGMSTTLFFANNEIIFSKMLTHKKKEVGNRIGRYMAGFSMAGSVARFAGPFVGAYIMHITSISGKEMNADCTRMAEFMVDHRTEGPFANMSIPSAVSGSNPWLFEFDTCPVETAAGDPIALMAEYHESPVCCFEGAYYCDAGCLLTDSNKWLWGIIAAGAFTWFLHWYYSTKMCTYEDTERAEREERFLNSNA